MSKGRKSKYWYLSQFSLSKRLKRSELKYLCDSSLMKNYTKGDQVFLEDDGSKSLFFLKKGTVKLIKSNAEGQSYVEYVMGQGSLFGLTTFLTEEDSEGEKFVCLTKAKVCKVPNPILHELMEKNKALHNYLLKLSGFKLKRLEYKLQNLLFKTYEERIRKFFPQFIKEFGEDRGPYYEMELFLKNKDIAQLTNTTRQKVNELMNQMKNEGSLSFDNKSIRWYK